MSQPLILAIDPGPATSGVVAFDPDARKVLWARSDFSNVELLRSMREYNFSHSRIVCEWIQAMGMPVGEEVFATCRFIGRIEEIVEATTATGATLELITRPTIKTRLCGSPRAKDPNVRQALIDRLGPAGTKKNPGPCYGVTGHAWSALAVAVAIDLP